MNLYNIDWRKNLTIFGLLITITMIVSSNTLINGFVWDDIQQISNNPWITSPAYLKDIFTQNAAGFDPQFATSYYRPMMYVLFMLIYSVFGLKSWGWHLTNVVLHTGVVIVLFLLAKEILSRSEGITKARAEKAAFIAAILFAVYPVHSEPVAWVSAQTEISYSLFFLLSIFFYIRSPNEKGMFERRYFISILLYFFAILSKEPAITLPLFIIASDYNNLRSFSKLPYRRYLPFVATVFIYLALRLNALGGFAPSKKIGDISSLDILINGWVLFAQYLKKLLIPINLKAMYSYNPAKNLLSLDVLISLIICLVFFCILWLCRKNGIVSQSLTLLFIPILPALYLPFLNSGIFAERYLYLPSAGLMILLGFGFSFLLEKKYRALTFSLLLAVTIFFAVESFNRNQVWKDSNSLWTDAVQKSPDSALAQLYYGHSLFFSGQLEEAEKTYLKALSIDNHLIDAHLFLGLVFHRTYQIDKAIDSYLMALKMSPKNLKAYEYLGAAFLSKGDLLNAQNYIKDGLSLNQRSPELYYLLGLAYIRMNRKEEALRSLESAVTLDPENQKYREILMKVLDKK